MYSKSKCLKASENINRTERRRGTTQAFQYVDNRVNDNKFNRLSVGEKSNSLLIKRKEALVTQLWGISSLTQSLPSVPETWKEKVDPRRWTINPYWKHYNQDEKSYEINHGRYHSRERHGGEHTLANIHARTQSPLGGNLAATGDSAMVHEGNPVRGFVSGGNPMPSGRFATPAWHTYSRNIAKSHASVYFPGVAWPANSPPHGIPNGNYHRFTTEYQGSPAGLSVVAGGPHTAQPAHFVLTGVQYNPATNEAWIIQHFPQSAAAPNGVLIPNKIVPYNQIPWFSTS